MSSKLVGASKCASFWMWREFTVTRIYGIPRNLFRTALVISNASKRRSVRLASKRLIARTNVLSMPLPIATALDSPAMKKKFQWASSIFFVSS
jgi:hypothetical protein